MAQYDHGGGCSCGLNRVCDCGVDKNPHYVVTNTPRPGDLPGSRDRGKLLPPIKDVVAAYPDDNPKTAVGITKPAMSAIPPTALVHLAHAMADGVRKYGRMNWREKKVSSTVYYDAAMRHMMAWYDGEDHAQDSGAHHLAHAMACLMILLDAREAGMLNDDRPGGGTTAELIARLTKSK